VIIRGILESIYVKMAPGKTAADLKKHLQVGPITIMLV
jgi:hypothetical protein